MPAAASNVKERLPLNLERRFALVPSFPENSLNFKADLSAPDRYNFECTVPATISTPL